MRRLSLTFRILTLVCATMLIFSIAGVSAVWLYTEGGPGEVSVEIPVTMNGEWEGSDILPDEEGVDHAWLINNLLNGTDDAGNAIGINNPDSDLSNTIEARINRRYNTFGSMATWDGGDLDELFGAEAAELEFLIEAVNTDNDGIIDYYYIYTIGIDLEYEIAHIGLSAFETIPYGEKIYPVYRTTVMPTEFEDGSVLWEATISESGYANSAVYETIGSGGLTSLPGIDPSTWTPYPNEDETYNTLGKSMDDPIWTYAGYENIVSLDTPNEIAYYAISMPDQNYWYWDSEETLYSLTITSSTNNCTFIVYDKDGGIITTSTTNADGVATANLSVYEEIPRYIAITGNTEITFTITQN